MIANTGFLKAPLIRFPLKRIERSAGGIFRARRGLPASNEWGPLTDLPDYSFLDGRVPKITSVGQRIRLINQYEMTKQIVSLSSELNDSNKKLVEKQTAEIRKAKAFTEKLFERKGLKKLEK